MEAEYNSEMSETVCPHPHDANTKEQNQYKELHISWTSTNNISGPCMKWN
jgi:hypothetical protein